MKPRLWQITIFFLYLCVGISCPSWFEQRDLYDHEQIVVDDFLEWLPDSLEDIESHLPWGKDMSDLIRLEEKAQRANYFGVDGHVKDYGDNVQKLADANPVLNRIRLYSDTDFWLYYFDVYEDLREKAELSGDDCSTETLQFRTHQARPFEILCHENAHMINIPNHAVVYEMGYACSDAVYEQVDDLITECLERDLEE